MGRFDPERACLRRSFRRLPAAQGRTQFRIGNMGIALNLQMLYHECIAQFSIDLARGVRLCGGRCY